MQFKILLTLAICAWTLNAQSQDYEFTVATGTYTDLVDPISLNEGQTWDDPQLTIPLGFDFNFFSTSFDTIYIEDIGLGAILSPDASETIIPLIAPFGTDIIDRGFVIDTSLSPLSYLLEGDVGNRILKVEWKNVGFYGELIQNGNSDDFVNFQMWLYEGTDNIEFHYGPNSVVQPELSYEGLAGTYVWLYPKVDLISGNYPSGGIELDGDPIAPDMIFDGDFYESFIDGTIPDGTIYQFKNKVTGIFDSVEEQINVSISPNPAADAITISVDENKLTDNRITIINNQGQIVKELNYTNGPIDISGLLDGIYFVNINTTSGLTTKRLVKK